LLAGSAAASELLRGQAALGEGDTAGAEDALRAAVEADPESASALYYLGIALAKQGKHAQSVDAFERALAIDPDHPRARLFLGIGLYHLDRHRDARVALERAVQDDPEDASARLFSGLNAQALGRHDDAIVQLERAAAADPALAQLALYNVGIAHWKEGRSSQATEALDRAVAADPDSEVAADAIELRDTIAHGRPTPRRWSLSGSAGTEYDSNVVAPDVDLLSGDFDVTGIFDVSASLQVVRTEHADVTLGYDFFQSLHRNESDFDLQSHGASVGASREFGWLDVGAQYQFAYAMLDWNELFLMHGARPDFGIAPVPWWYTEFSYQFWQKDFAQSARDARHHGAGVDQYFFFADQQAYLRLAYRAATEDARGAEFDFFGHFAEADLHLPLPFFGATEMDLGYAYTIRDYRNVTPSIGEKRADRRHHAEFGLTRRFAEVLLARIEYEFALADSNLPAADYTQHIARVKLGFDF